MLHRSIRTMAAAGLVLLLAASPVAASDPAAGTRSTFGPFTTGMFPAATGLVSGAVAGPDGTLYLYGNFDDACGDPTADDVVAWNPATGSCHGLGSNGTGDGAFNTSPDAFSASISAAAWLNGVLYVGGHFANAGGAPTADYLAAWNGSSWSGRGTVNGDVWTLAVVSGSLYAGGAFTDLGGSLGDFAARWDGWSWSALGTNGSGGPALDSVVMDFAVGPGGRLYAVGDFDAIGGDLATQRAAVFDTTTGGWSSIDGSTGVARFSIVNHVAVSGTRVVLAGLFANAGGNKEADYVVEWTGSAWRSYGNRGTDIGALDGAVEDVTFYGSDVIVTGPFDTAGNVPGTQHLAMWNGSTWVALGSPTYTFGTSGWSVMPVGRTLYVGVAGGYFLNIASHPSSAAFSLPAAPSAPRSLAGVAGSKKVALTWAAPAATNGAPVTDYIVQYRKKGTTTWRTFADGVRTTRSASVTGLASGVTYEFRVKAKNAWGTGSPSPVIARKAG